MGKLNLLHHKSWHVYSKDNRERVRKDEEEAGKVEKEKESRAIKAEQERRMEQLRASKKGEKETQEDNRKPREDNRNQHVNLFHDFDQSVVLVDERAEEQRKWEDKHTMYLGETKDGKKDVPWYNQVNSAGISSRKSPPSLNETDEKKRKRKERQEEKRKRREDPMEALKKFMETRNASAAPPTSHRVSKRSAGAPSSSKSIEQLRQERLERELAERNRTQQAVNPSHGNFSDTHDSSKRFYNSQFNPNLVRKDNR